MAKVTVVIYQEKNVRAELPGWLDKQPDVAKVKLQDKMDRLAAEGPHLKRPHSAPLGQGIFELRADHGHKHYRILYGFPGGGKAMLSHGLIKIKKIPLRETKKAKQNLDNYKKDPQSHTYRGEL